MILVIYLAARRIMLHALAQPITPIPWSTMLLTTPSVLWFDLKHLLFPISSSEFYSLTYVTTPGWENFLLPTLLLLVALVATGYFISRLPDPRLGVFALGFAIATILPTLYLRAIAPGNFVHDRFLYLPSVGVVILIAVALERIVGWKSSVAIGWAVVAVLCCAAFAGTVSYQMQWASNILLYQNALKYAPDNPVVQVNLANEFANLGHYDRAFPLYLSALQSDPRSWLSNYNLGYAYYRTGRAAEAEEYLKRAIQIDDKDPDQFIYLALAQMQRGELTDAAQNAERAIEKAPMSGGFHLVHGQNPGGRRQPGARHCRVHGGTIRSPREWAGAERTPATSVLQTKGQQFFHRNGVPGVLARLFRGAVLPEILAVGTVLLGDATQGLVPSDHPRNQQGK